MKLHRHIALSLLAGGAPVASAQAESDPPPNFVLIMVDDMGYGDAGSYGFDPPVALPHVDRIAERGIRFTDGYVTAPMCGPSRYGLLTGVYSQRFGIQDNRDCFGRLPPDALARLGLTRETLEENRIPAGQQILNEPFRDAGYVTGLVGKWNLFAYPETTFCESFSVIHFGADYWPDEHGHYVGVDEPVPVSNSKRPPQWGPEREGDEYLTDRLGRQAVEFIERHAGNPFLLYLSFNAPHSPLEAKSVHRPYVAHLPSEALRMYWAMMLSLDENVGRVLNALEEAGIADHTLLAFLSDNGPTFAFNVGWPEEWPKELLGGTGPLSGHKAQFREGGIRIPFMIQWPARWDGGQVYTRPVSALDFYPTFLAAAGLEPPEQPMPLDGVNLIPFIDGEQSGDPHDTLYWHINQQGAVRRGDWKLLVQRGHYALFDLQQDIGETTDLQGTHPEQAQQLRELYRNFVDELPPKVN